MTRLTRNTVILAKAETTYGVDAAPVAPTHLLLIANQGISYNYNNVDRALVRPHMGGSEQLAGTRHVEITHDVELSGAGTAGAIPAYGALLRGVGMAEVQSIGNRVEYTPITSGFESLTKVYYDDGLLHKALGCRGTAEFKMALGERPLISCKFIGIDGGVVVEANPTGSNADWKAPVVITDQNAGDITLGCAYAAGALTAGTTYPSRGINVSLGQDVKYIPMLGGQSVDITSRETTGSIDLELTATQEAAMMDMVNNNTLTSLGFSFGTVAGAKILIFMPAVQLTNPKKTDMDGRRLISFDLRILPSAGNDEFRLVVL